MLYFQASKSVSSEAGSPSAPTEGSRVGGTGQLQVLEERGIMKISRKTPQHLKTPQMQPDPDLGTSFTHRNMHRWNTSSQDSAAWMVLGASFQRCHSTFMLANIIFFVFLLNVDKNYPSLQSIFVWIIFRNFLGSDQAALREEERQT